MKKNQNIFCNFLQMKNILCGIKEPDGKVVLEKLISVLQQHSPELDIAFGIKDTFDTELLDLSAPGVNIVSSFENYGPCTSHCKNK